MYKWCCDLQKQVPSGMSHKDDHVNTCMRLVKEIAEVLDCVDWKYERDDPRLLDSENEDAREHLAEELVDVFNYFMRLCWLHGITPEEFEKAWLAKRDIIEKRLLPCPK